MQTYADGTASRINERCVRRDTFSVLFVSLPKMAMPVGVLVLVVSPVTQSESVQRTVDMKTARYLLQYKCPEVI